MTARTALRVLIASTAALRLAWAASIGLGHDEAYHYLFAARPSLSYFDHPPMLAVVESIGPILTGSTSPLSLRLGFVLMFAGSTWLLARIATRLYDERAGLFAAFAMNVSAYHTAAAGAFVLPDGPLLFFWLLTLDRMLAALDEPAQVRRWIPVGLAWGLALLSKYHAVFLPAGLLVYIAWTPSARRILRMPGPYAATVVGVACFAPVLIWNAGHGWASFAFQGGRAVARTSFRPLSLLASFGGQCAYLLPWIWAALLVVMAGGFRRLAKGQGGQAERFLLSQSVTPIAVFSAVACMREVLPHWTLIGYVSAYPLLGRAWAERAAQGGPSIRRRFAVMAAVPVGLATLMALQHRLGVVPLGRLAASTAKVDKVDPTAQSFGWDQVAAEIRRRGLAGAPGTFIFTNMWYNSGHLAYEMRGDDVPILCYHANDARSFAFWSDPREWVGRDGVLVSVNGRSDEEDGYRRFFERIEPAGEFPVVRSGEPLRTIRLFRCIRQVTPFPFVYGTPPPAEPAARIAAGRGWR